VDIDVDSDRNGTIDGTPKEEALEETQAAIVPVNCDDDDSFARDCDNDLIDGPADVADLIPIVIHKTVSGWTARLEILEGDPSKLRVFGGPDPGPGGSPVVLGKSIGGPITTYQIGALTSDLTYYAEAAGFRTSPSELDWKLGLMVTKGAEELRDVVILRPSPFVLLPASASPEEIYVGGAYERILELALEAGGYTQDEAETLVVASSDKWCQNNVEIGFTSWPSPGPTGENHMFVYWDLNSKNDSQNDAWIGQQLGPDRGYFKAEPYAVGYFEGGTIEVSEGGLGGILFGEGHRQTTPDFYPTDVDDYNLVAEFFAAQGIQPAVTKVDTTWLSVGHIDEVLSCGAGKPDTGVTEAILNELDNGFAGQADGPTFDSNELYDTDIPSIAEQTWPGGFIKITGGRGSGQIRQVKSVDPQAGILVVAKAWTILPDGTSQYSIAPKSAYRAMFATGDEDCGVISGIRGTSMLVLQDETKSWQPYKWNGGYILIVEGTGAGHDPVCISNSTASEIMIDNPGFSIDIGDRYVVVQGSKPLLGLKGSTYLAFTVVRSLLDYWDQDSFQQKINNSIGGFSEPGIPALYYTVTGTNWKGYDNRAYAWLPNMVNCLSAGRVRIVVSKPFAINGIVPDPFEVTVTTLYGGTVVYIDVWDEYHLDGGGIHCGTAVKRRPDTWKWW